VDVTGSGYRPEGELLVDGRPLDDPFLLGEVRFVIGGGSLANDAVLRETDGEWTIQGDPTDAAFLAAEGKIAGLTEAREQRFERVGEVPFTSERKLMSTLEADEREGGVAVVTTGAPDVLLTRCAAERVAGENRPLTNARRTEVSAAVDRLAGSHCAPSPSRTAAFEAGEPTHADDRSARPDLPRAGGDHRPARPGADGDRGGLAESAMLITGDHPGLHPASRPTWGSRRRAKRAS
jgi:hypothetical protein